ncbi:unnamed protein product [Symbiodinium natans]|uniref:Uncharacterized protein n=1 Tax=Symbiodinium natans TaxID=878477 RepID=A0A812TT74_9DINO|nr:unnamed protein product [Symbiodinium natans]
MRGIPLQKTLWHLGVLWRKSPLALSPEARTGLWKMSAPASTFDIFLSHTWHTPGKWKILSLFFQSGWRFSFLGWFVGASLMLLASTHKLLPLFIPYRSNFDGATISCGAASRCLLGSLLGHGLGLLLSPYAPSACARRPLCFLDVASIHQTDRELMERGIYSIGGFLHVSKELQVLWSAPYLSRLWCIFELAAYRTANPSGRVVLSPLFVECGACICILGAYFAAFLFVFALPLQHFGIYVVYVVGLLPIYVLMHLLRRNILAKHQLFEGLRFFTLAEARCESDFDHDFIHTAIRAWYGSAEAFTAYVQGSLRQELLASKPTTIPLRYLVLLVGVPFGLSLDFLAALIAREAPMEWLLTEFLAGCLGFNLCWFFGSVQIALFLCDRFAAPWRGGLFDYLQTLVLFLIFFGVYFLGSLMASTSNLWHALAVASASLLFAIVTLVCRRAAVGS